MTSDSPSAPPPAAPQDVAASPANAPHTLPTDHPGDPNVELEAERFNAHRDAWVEAYVHVWSDLSRGSFDSAAIAQSADEHWKRSPESDPVQVAVMAFMQPDKPA